MHLTGSGTSLGILRLEKGTQKFHEAECFPRAHEESCIHFQFPTQVIPDKKKIPNSRALSSSNKHRLGKGLCLCAELERLR